MKVRCCAQQSSQEFDPWRKSPITGAAGGGRLPINGSEHLLQIESRVTLLDALRSFAIGLTLRKTEARHCASVKYGDILQTSLGNP